MNLFSLSTLSFQTTFRWSRPPAVSLVRCPGAMRPLARRPFTWNSGLSAWAEAGLIGRLVWASFFFRISLNTFDFQEPFSRTMVEHRPQLVKCWQYLVWGVPTYAWWGLELRDCLWLLTRDLEPPRAWVVQRSHLLSTHYRAEPGRLGRALQGVWKPFSSAKSSLFGQFWVDLCSSFFFLIVNFERGKEGREGRKRGRETLMWEKHQLIASGKPGLQPRYMPSPGIELVTFWFAGRCPPHWGTRAY